MSLEYYEDVKLHQKRRSSVYLLTEQKIIEFGQEWDPFPLHVDPEFAEKSEFGGLIAPGALLISILVKLVREMSPQVANSVVLAWEETRFLAPGRPGDRLIAETEVISKRQSKNNPGVGVVGSMLTLFNQRNDPVITLKAVGLAGKQPQV